MRKASYLKENLSINTLNRLRLKFEYLGWLEEEELFLDFCAMLSRLNQEQQDLILEMTGNFLKVDLPNYYPYIHNALSLIKPEEFATVTQIYVLPLLDKDDYGKPKSSTFLAYLFQSQKVKKHQLFLEKKITIGDKPDILPISDRFNRSQSKLMLVDDFIGSGKTAIDALSDLVDNIGININKIIILSLVAQLEGIEKIKSKGVSVYAPIIRKKGISESYDSPQKEDYMRIMTQVENGLKVREENRFGFNQSEALVSMIRTPNDTFPVFWYEPKIDGIKCKAPFPRF
jgi:hypothetical protein